MKRSLNVAIGLAVTGLIAGCGSSGESNSGMAPPIGVDAFTESVQGVMATTSDTVLPMSIDGIVATNSDNTAPVGI